jgi:hypothetical protein
MPHAPCWAPTGWHTLRSQAFSKAHHAVRTQPTQSLPLYHTCGLHGLHSTELDKECGVQRRKTKSMTLEVTGWDMEDPDCQYCRKECQNTEKELKNQLCDRRLALIFIKPLMLQGYPGTIKQR